jgi:hypothetical protein
MNWRLNYRNVQAENALVDRILELSQRDWIDSASGEESVSEGEQAD